MYRDGSTPVGSICETLQISQSTFYRYLAAANPTRQAIEECEAIPKPGADGDPTPVTVSGQATAGMAETQAASHQP